MKLTVKKNWEDENGHIENRNEYVDVKIKRDGVDFKTVRLTPDDASELNPNKWEKTIDVDQYSDDENKVPYKYTVSEITDNPLSIRDVKINTSANAVFISICGFCQKLK